MGFYTFLLIRQWKIGFHAEIIGSWAPGSIGPSRAAALPYNTPTPTPGGVGGSQEMIIHRRTLVLQVSNFY